MCGVPLLNRLCREGYNDPPEVYETLQQRGMDLVTVTDHDSIDAVESLRRHTDFEPAVATYPAAGISKHARGTYTSLDPRYFPRARIQGQRSCSHQTHAEDASHTAAIRVPFCPWCGAKK